MLCSDLSAIIYKLSQQISWSMLQFQNSQKLFWVIVYINSLLSIRVVCTEAGNKNLYYNASNSCASPNFLKIIFHPRNDFDVAPLYAEVWGTWFWTNKLLTVFALKWWDLHFVIQRSFRLHWHCSLLTEVCRSTIINKQKWGWHTFLFAKLQVFM